MAENYLREAEEYISKNEPIQASEKRALRGNKLLYVRVREPTLEDVYLALLSKQEASGEKVLAPLRVCYVFTGEVSRR